MLKDTVDTLMSCKVCTVDLQADAKHPEVVRGASLCNRAGYDQSKLETAWKLGPALPTHRIREAERRKHQAGGSVNPSC